MREGCCARHVVFLEPRVLRGGHRGVTEEGVTEVGVGVVSTWVPADVHPKN